MTVTINRAWYGLLLMTLAGSWAEDASKVPLHGWHIAWFVAEAIMSIAIMVWGFLELIRGLWNVWREI